MVRSTVSFNGECHSVVEDKCAPVMADEGKPGDSWTSNGHGIVGFPRTHHENCFGVSYCMNLLQSKALGLEDSNTWNSWPLTRFKNGWYKQNG
ncbi:hypothetical protein CDL15_Pgr012399 [Punica granatum]|uniref:Uncharacterized protein n=1 Tax=Punica granatum TaxID=22663 RepID=A0A218W1U7_PUNGR|nr:hypothetical protein CDL15_Pgr012399 [Punica granatum]